ncbi:hypothetical protein MNBD_NITROSPINAE04-2168 [hydrothermal vent metagenome]|uniref:Uncharacterized protein n=1 Tax=hydrothermal vent metagenome TaxID=652676 RepID=A0A3B1CSC1_9ZZZZ
MIAENKRSQKPNVAHDGINGYGTVVDIKTGKAQDLAAYERYAAELMKAVTARCVSSGAIDIGHIKAYLEGAGLFVYASAVGDAPDITVKSEGDGSPAAVSLTINSVVYGIDKEALKNATDDALDEVTGVFGFTITKR